MASFRNAWHEQDRFTIFLPSKRGEGPEYVPGINYINHEQEELTTDIPPEGWPCLKNLMALPGTAIQSTTSSCLRSIAFLFCNELHLRSSAFAPVERN